MVARIFAFVAAFCLLLAGAANAQGKPELQWFAQSAFKLTTPGRQGDHDRSLDHE